MNYFRWLDAIKADATLAVTRDFMYALYATLAGPGSTDTQETFGTGALHSTLVIISYSLRLFHSPYSSFCAFASRAALLGVHAPRYAISLFGY